MNHWVWDDDPDESLCGKDVSHKKWNDGSVDCLECIEVDKFVRLVESFLERFDVKDSLFAAVGVWKSNG